MKKIAFLLTVVLVVLAGCSTPPPPAPAAPEPVVRVSSAFHIEIRDGDALVLEKPEEEPSPYQAINGIEGVAIEPKDVIITFEEDSLADGIKAGTPAESIITNLPAGLSARVREAIKGSHKVTILVEGIPEVTLNEPIHLSIPGTFLVSGQSLDVVSNEAKFEILQGDISLTSHVSAQPPAPDYVYINGSVGYAFTVVDIRVSLIEASLKEAIEKETPVDWVTNLPNGLNASVQPAAAGATVLILTLQGTPQQSQGGVVQVTVPAAVLGDIYDFAVPNETILWRIRGATAQSVLIDGSVGHTITTKDLKITLGGTQVAADIAVGTVVSWIDNLPAGLTARAKQVKAGENTVTITVAGTPSAVSVDALSITLPADAVAGGSPLRVIANANTRFAINDNTKQISTTDVIGNSSNPEWLKTQKGPLNVPVLPTIKDFDGVGIVSVTATQVEKLGADNQYHWSGQNVNYGLLMEEARKLGAHAIINVVIDYTDSVENIEAIRELSADHKWTPDEEAQLAQGILKEQKANGLRYAVEVSHIITRTYHGTALAIKYKDGLNYYEAEELRVNTPIAPVPTR